MNRVSRITRVFLLCLILLAPLAAGQDGFYLKDGDRVVFYCESITAQRLYTTFVETFVVTRFPRLQIGFVHSGWGGDRVTGGGGGNVDVRLERDVIAHKPTVMTIMLGMNDGRYRAYDAEIFNTYSGGYRHIIEKVKRALPGIRITAIQPSPYDDVTRPPTFEGGYNAVLVRYGQFLKELAQQENLTLADLNTLVVAALEKAKARNAETAARIVPDRVHPGPSGHLLMAAALLKAWKAPATVSSITIDANAKKVARTDNADVNGLEVSDRISWTQTDRALPMFVDMKDPVMELAVESSDFVETLDEQILKVTGLRGARYVLKIDGEEIGSFTGQGLAEGVNLALRQTPMSKQASEVHALTIKHNTIHWARWRQVQVPLQNDALDQSTAAMDSLDRLEAELVRKQRAAAQPKPHRYELLPEAN